MSTMSAMATDRELAERYWDDHLMLSTWPADVEQLAKMSYLRSVLARPEDIAYLRKLYEDE